jgi:hypothetical protein
MTEALRSERLDIFIACAEKRIQTLKGLFRNPEENHPRNRLSESIADNNTWIELLTRLMAEKKAEIERVQVKKSARNRVQGAYTRAVPSPPLLYSTKLKSPFFSLFFLLNQKGKK